MGLALHNFHDTNGAFPQGVENPGEAPNIPGRPKGYHPFWSWMAQLMPYYEQDNLYRLADNWAHIGPGDASDLHWWPWGDFDNNFAKGDPNPALGTLVAVWTCPADNRTLQVTYLSSDKLSIAFTAYLGVSGLRGDDESLLPRADKSGMLFGSAAPWFNASRAVRMHEVTDGLSNTLFVGERPPSNDLEFGWWFAGAGYERSSGGSGTGDVVLGAHDIQFYKRWLIPKFKCSSNPADEESKLGLKPGDLNSECDSAHFWSLHAGGANFLAGDGSVHFVSYNLDPTTFQALCTRNFGEVVPDSF
jgi:prepilin-type processing-associated H-X9-DG protein